MLVSKVIEHDQQDHGEKDQIIPLSSFFPLLILFFVVPLVLRFRLQELSFGLLGTLARHIL